MTHVSTGQLTLTDSHDLTYALLSSDAGQVSVDAAGTPKTPLSTTPLVTQMSVYKGIVLQTGWTFTRTQSDATSSVGSSTGVLTVTGISADSAYVDITASKNGEPTLTKRYVMTKVYQGEGGVPAPRYMGLLSALPTSYEGGPLVDGDFFLCSAAFTDGAQYAKGVVYGYDGSSWSATSDSGKIMAAMDDFSKLGMANDSLLAGNLFAQRFIAMDATIKTLFARLIEIQSGGAIFSGFTADGVPPSSGAGFHLSWNGLMQAVNALLIGTLRTGLNAPTNARVGIRDAAGIIEGPTHVGSGLNDLTIASDGAVAVTARVRIETTPAYYEVGDTGPAGGKIFHIANGVAYECAPASTEWSSKVWGGRGYLVSGTGTAVGTGAANTNAIVAAYGSAEPYQGKTDYAAKLCSDLSFGGCSDWFLPSRDEWQLLHEQYAMIGDFYDSVYWTSSEIDNASALVRNPRSVYAGGTAYKDYAARVRAIRSFSVSYDVFKVSIDDGASYGSGVTIPESKTYAIPDKEITIAFGSRGGHTVGDYWRFVQGAMKGLVIQKSNGTQYFEACDGAVSIVGTLGATRLNTANDNKGSGYSGLTNGMVLQWGSLSLSQNATGSVTFPLSFPNACLHVNLQGSADNTYYTNGIAVKSMGASGFSYELEGVAQTVYWMAIGY